MGNGSEHIQWSANSDKWVMQDISWWGHAERVAWGGNQVVMNWVDTIALNITNTRKGPVNPTNVANLVEPAGICISNSSGDLWIDDPVNNPTGTKYEDLLGVWHSVPGAIPTSVKSMSSPAQKNIAPIVSISGSQIRITYSGTGSEQISLLSMDGRSIRSLQGTGAYSQVSTAGLSKGMYLLKTHSINSSFLQRILIK